MSDDRYSRQGFLGERSEEKIGQTKVGIIGYGGGGSQIGPQLAHLGFQDYEVFDPDRVEYSNLNRMKGATVEDANQKRLKVEVAKRIILGLQPGAYVGCHAKRWQDDPDALRRCQIIFGCVDGYAERRELEAFCRRNMIVLIDIGLDIHAAEGEAPQMAGQILLSVPGSPCMWCYGLLNEERLTKEAAAYGAAGIRPQVVWANGVLASTAVGLAVDVVTDWTKSLRKGAYLQYHANNYTVVPHPHVRNVTTTTCPHFPLSEVGDVIMQKL